MKLLKQGAMVALVAFAASGAFAQDVFHEFDVVHDARGNVVKNTWGHCVHTRWKSGAAECDVAAAPAPVRTLPRAEPAPAPKSYK